MVYFLVFVFPIVILFHGFLYHKKPTLSALWIITSSIILLCLLEPFSLVLLVTLSSFTLLLIKLLKQFPERRKQFLCLGIVINLSPLILFKFIGQFIGTEWYRNTDLNGLGFLDLGIPIGVSFFTLFQISALVDVYKNKVMNTSIIEHFQYSFFFPNYTSGPFLLYRDGIGQLKNYHKKLLKFDYGRGLSLIILGLAKKVLLADQLSVPISNLYEALHIKGTLTILEAWFIFWGFMVQLYLDFSAYSDIAIGMGLCLGILLPINFNSPLKATSLLDYIYRWHISFLVYVREYVFSPVSNFVAKKLVPKLPSTKKYYLAWVTASTSTYIIIGIWHAPSLNTAIYTSIAVLILVLPQLIKAQQSSGKQVNLKIPVTIKRLTLLFTLCFTVTIFRIPDLDNFLPLLQSLVDIRSVSMSTALQPVTDAILPGFFKFDGFFPSLADAQIKYDGLLSPAWSIFYLILVTIGIFILPNTMQMLNLYSGQVAESKFKLKQNWAIAVLLGLLTIAIILISSVKGETSFIYQLL